jgi:hypothetical protein
MMFEQENDNLQYIVKDKNLLLYSDENIEHLSTIFQKFKNVLIEEANDFTITNLNTTISKSCIDIIIINSKYFQDEIYLTLLEIITYEELTIILCHNKDDKVSEELINLSSTVFTHAISQELFSHKLYNAMQNRILNAKSKSIELEDTYIDSFEIEIIFIRDELFYISEQIDKGNTTKNIFLRILQSINRINRILDNYIIYSKKIKNSMENLSKMLENVNMDTLTVECFNYLSRIIEDIATFLNNYFIKRTFNDLYVVEDSLENSLKFLENSFNVHNDKEDGSSLEFFHD